MKFADIAMPVAVVAAGLVGMGLVVGGFLAMERADERSREHLRAVGHEGAHVLLRDGRPGVVTQADWAAFGSVWVRYHARAGDNERPFAVDDLRADPAWQ